MKSEPILSLQGIVKRFPGVIALNNASLDFLKGEVHILVGANGAGKSTLVKIIAGVYQPDGGTICLRGEPINIKGPHKAQEMGISVVHQNFSLIGVLDIAQNVFLNREPLKGKVLKRIDWKRMYDETRVILDRIGLNVDPKTKVENLPIADQQMIEIVKALSIESEILILDEPTSSLSEQEVDELFMRILKLKEEGVCIIYISHRVEDFNRIGDKVSVLRDGQTVGSGSISKMNLEEITKRMLGRNLQDIYTWEQRKLGKELIRIENLSSHVGFKDISFTLKEGEILGIAGVVGAKRTELAHAIIGALPIYGGSIYYKGKPVKIRRPKDAVKFGIGVLHEDKSKHGMFPALSVAKNTTSVGLEKIKRRWGISLGFEGEVVEKFRKRLNIQTASIENKINVLSGGNQQKVMFSKMMFANSEILILDEPTKGIDIGAKQEIFKLINDLANEGKGIIFISSELPEVVGMCDRILVMKQGKIVEEILREEVSEEKILRSAL